MLSRLRMNLYLLANVYISERLTVQEQSEVASGVIQPGISFEN
jgi:hypothetical protein